jgi:diguanylate cyclase (GGDEF)-like protein
MADSAQRIYIADDDPGILLLSQEILSGEGFVVAVFDTATALLERCRAELPDLIMMDVEMPGLNGFTACSRLRAEPGTALLPIIMITGHDDTESINRAYAAGATDFIAKPVNWPLLSHRVRYVLRASRIHIDLDERENENRALLTAIPDAILVVHNSGHIVRAPHGLQRHEALIDCVQQRFADTDQRAGKVDLLHAVRRISARGVPESIELSTTDFGATQTFELRCAPLGDSEVLVIARDISERKAAEKHIHRLAYFDPLTGLPNRAHFMDELERALGRACEHGSKAATLYLDLDRFKRINDTYGHSIGDHLLRSAARRITEECGDADGECFIARLGGDEFTLLLADVRDAGQVNDLVDRITRAFVRPISAAGHDFVITPSIGIAMFPDHGPDAETLLKNADAAMYCAKTRGRNRCTVYDPSMNAKSLAALEMENLLRGAIERDEIFAWYQPKRRISDSALIGAEALVRWATPERGIIPASEFIPVAEETGMIVELGRAVLRHVMRQLALWMDQGFEPVPIAVNLSAMEFGLGDIVTEVRTLLELYGVPAQLLELEITESALLLPTTAVTASIRGLRAMGCRIAIDDFGTGYSSLSYLQNLEIDALKIDRSFVQKLPNRRASAICDAVVALGRGLDLEVIVEGVETPDQLEFFRKRHCNSVQGFLTGRPADAATLETELARAAGGKLIAIGR